MLMKLTPGQILFHRIGSKKCITLKSSSFKRMRKGRGEMRRNEQNAVQTEKINFLSKSESWENAAKITVLFQG